MRSTQRSRLLSLLQSRRGQWVPLPEILTLGFSQFGARILELRRIGHAITNKTEHRAGKVLSWYRLDSEPTHEKRPEQSAHSLPSSFPEFGPLAKESYGVD
jgi:hypothetical protein